MTGAPPGSLVRLFAQSSAAAEALRRLAAERDSFGERVDVAVLDAAPGEVVARLRGAGVVDPIGLIAETEEDAFAAIAAGADDARTADGLDLPRYLAFVDRVTLRARQRRETEKRLAVAAHGEKLASLGSVIAGVAHEVNNPLSVIVLVVDSLRSALDLGTPPEELRDALDDAATALQTVTEVVRDLRHLARSDEEERPEPVYLPDLADHVLRLVGRPITAAATLERDYGTDVPSLLLPRSRVTQVLTNLLVNAAQAIGEERRAVHRVRVSIRCDDETVALAVSDTGPGIAPDIVGRIFDPFFTTKGREAGTGLGLSISRAIVRGLGGDLVAESVHGEGATFIAMIPIEGRRVVHPSRQPHAGPRPSHPARASILVVEDEEPVLRSIAAALRHRFHVILAAEGQEAVDLLSSGSTPDAVLCGLTTPIADGRRLHEWLAQNRRDLARKTVFTTASATAESARLVAEGGRPVLEKPLTRERLLAALDRVLSPST